MPETIEERISELHTALEEESEFKVPYKKFLTITEDHPDFAYLGKKRKNPLLTSILVNVLERVYGEGKPLNVMMVFIKDFKLYHGTVLVNFKPGRFFYFTDIKMGLIAVAKGLGPDMSYIRFVGDEVAGSNFFINNTSNTTH